MGKVLDVLAPRNLELGPLTGSAPDQGPWKHWRLARDENGVAWLAYVPAISISDAVPS